MTLITDSYRDLNRQLHERVAGFGAGGRRWEPNVRDISRSLDTADILDYGCGKGTLAAVCRDLNIRNYDPAVPAFAAEPEPADIVVCTDVLEHIEPDHVSDVLAHIARLTRKMALLVVYTKEATKCLPDGRNAHLSIHDGLWWFRETHKHLEVIKTNVRAGWFLMLARPWRKRSHALALPTDKQQSMVPVDDMLVASIGAQCRIAGDLPGNALTNSGFQAMVQGEYAIATQFFRRAIQLDSGNKYAWDNLASCYKNLGREAEAMQIYERLIAADPDFIFAHNNYANSLLRQCQFERGWQEYRWRLKSSRKNQEVIEPLRLRRLSMLDDPTTEQMRSKGVFLAREQGLGDELFFLRFAAPFMKKHGVSTMFYQPSDKLAPLLRRSPNLPVTLVQDTTTWVTNDTPVIPLGELPRLTGHRGEDDIPPPIQLTVRNRLLWPGWWRRRPAAWPIRGRRTIGVTWEAGIAGARHRGGLHKAIGPAELGATLKAVDADIIVVQRNMRQDDYRAFCEALGRPAMAYQPDHTPDEELEFLLALLGELDDYVGVSNTNVYLLQALKKSARVLLPFPPVWRWTAKPGESPWFPGFHTYREQVEPYCWDDALEQLRNDLR